MPLNLLSGLLLIKIGFLILLFMFVIFMLIAIKQVRAMNEIITQHELFPLILAGGVSILVVALVLFAVTLVIL